MIEIHINIIVCAFYDNLHEANKEETMEEDAEKTIDRRHQRAQPSYIMLLSYLYIIIHIRELLLFVLIYPKSNYSYSY